MRGGRHSRTPGAGATLTLRAPSGISGAAEQTPHASTGQGEHSRPSVLFTCGCAARGILGSDRYGSDSSGCAGPHDTMAPLGRPDVADPLPRPDRLAGVGSEARAERASVRRPSAPPGWHCGALHSENALARFVMHRVVRAGRQIWDWRA